MNTINSPLNFITSSSTQAQASQNISSRGDVSSEACRLKNEGIIGENTLIAGSLYSGTSIIYWSEKDNSQYHAYKSLGTEAGLQAAEYHKQMVAERQDLANDYFDQMYDLADAFNQLGLEDERFKNFFFNSLDDETPLTQTKSGELHSDSQLIEQFWQNNQDAIDKLEKTLSNLESFPEDLEAWLLQQPEEVSDQVHLIVDQYKHSWAAGNQEITPDYQPNYTVVGRSAGTQTEDNVQANNDDAVSLIRSMEKLNYDSAKNMYTSFGDLSYLYRHAAEDYMSIEKGRIHQEMQTITKELFPAFSQQFGDSAGYPDYSLQDMVDNYLADQPLALLDSGQMHTMEKEINDFWAEHELALNAYSYKQEQINKPIEGPELQEFIGRNKSQISQYLLGNMEQYLNKEVQLNR